MRKGIFFADRGHQVSQRQFRDTGQMIAPAVIAQVGVMRYYAEDCGPRFSHLPPKQIVIIGTREKDLFDPTSMKTYRGAPITIDHPAVDVDIFNAKELQHGHLDGEVFRDNDTLCAHVVLSDHEAIDRVEIGQDNLSSGHDAGLEMNTTGEMLCGVVPDAFKINIRCNHVAIVPKGRASQARILDANNIEGDSMTIEELIAAAKEKHGVVLISQETADAQVAEKDGIIALRDAAIVDAATASEGLQAKLDAEIAAHNATKEQLANAGAKFTDAAMAETVNKRLAFLKDIARFSDKDFVEMSEPEAMRVVLHDHLGIDLKDKSDAYVTVRYEVFRDAAIENSDADNAMGNAFRDHAQKRPDPAQLPEDEAAKARARMVARHTQSK